TNPPGMKFQYDVVTNYPLQPQHLTHVGLDRDDFWISGHTKENRTVYSMFLTDEQAKKMQKAPDVVSLEPGSGSPVGFPLFPAAMDNSWDLNNYGPLMVPQKGTNIQINETTLDFYGELIQKYEGNRHV